MKRMSESSSTTRTVFRPPTDTGWPPSRREARSPPSPTTVVRGTDLSVQGAFGRIRSAEHETRPEAVAWVQDEPVLTRPIGHAFDLGDHASRAPAGDPRPESGPDDRVVAEDLS